MSGQVCTHTKSNAHRQKHTQALRKLSQGIILRTLSGKSNNLQAQTEIPLKELGPGNKSVCFGNGFPVPFFF